MLTKKKKEALIRLREATIKDNLGARSEFGCKYRHKGRTCAVGFFIPDENYSRVIEGECVAGIYSLVVSPFSSSELQILQTIHDDFFSNVSRKEAKLLFTDFLSVMIETNLDFADVDDCDIYDVMDIGL